MFVSEMVSEPLIARALRVFRFRGTVHDDSSRALAVFSEIVMGSMVLWEKGESLREEIKFSEWQGKESFLFGV